MISMYQCIAIFLQRITLCIENCTNAETLKKCRSAKLWTELRQNNNVCLECWIDKLLEHGHQDFLQQVWFPIRIIVLIKNYQKNRYFLREAIRRIFSNDSKVVAWSTYFKEGDINVGYFVDKVIRYGEQAKLQPIEDLLPKRERRLLNKAPPKNYINFDRCFVCEDSSNSMSKLV